jgi:acetyl esterase/lipase
MIASRSLLTLALFLMVATSGFADEKRPVFNVWPGKAPGETGDVGEEKTLPPRGNKPVTRLANVTKPTVIVYQASKKNRNGAAVVVCPGGGYGILAWDLEGTEVAEWLNSIGVTAFVLKYRVPRRKDRPKHEAPLQDAQRTMSLVRSQAEKFDIDPNRIGILGFSAGGHLSATTSTNFDKRSYKSIDKTDEISCRPDFAVLIYPAYLITEDGLALEIRVSKQSPPTFFAHAYNDGITPKNSIRMFLALKKVGVKAALHVYSSGGHGFGLRPTASPSSTWPTSCEAWLKSLDLLKKATTE